MVLLRRNSRRRRLRPIFNTAGSQASFPDDATIAASHDTVPNFALSPDILSAQSGNWSSTSTWEGGVVPGAGDKVGIQTTHTVTYDVDAVTELEAVGVAGTLDFITDGDTQLWLQHLIVYGPATLGAGNYGHLKVGTAASPVGSGFTAEIVFTNTAIDTGTVESPGVDPAQYGNGMHVFGKLTTHGTIKTRWLRLGAEPAATDTALTISAAVTGWAVGDLLVLPDSRQLDQSIAGQIWGEYVPQWETRTIDSLASGNTVANLSSALTYDHPGGENGFGVGEGTGASAFYPHVANLTCNVIFRSELGTGVRGHTMFHGRADVDVRYTRFKELGRTSNLDLNSTTFDGEGNVTAIGTNQIGRYAIHCHHLMGPVTTPANGYQWTMIGCVIDDPLPAPPSADLPASKWAVTIHGSHYGLFQNNVMHHYAGSGLMTEDGSESFNVFDGNFACNNLGHTNPRVLDGRSGAGYFFSGFNHYVRNNVAAGNAGKNQGIVTGSGYEFFTDPSSIANFRNPLFKGADTAEGAEGVDYELVNARLQPILEFADCEAYGASAGGLVLWQLGSDGYTSPSMPTSTVLNFKVWHCWEEAYFGYPTMNVTFDGLTVRGDPALFKPSAGTTGIAYDDYWAGGTTLFVNADIRGVITGWHNTRNIRGDWILRDSYFLSYERGVIINVPSTPGTVAGSGDHTITIDNCTFDQHGASATFQKIDMDYSLAHANTNLRVSQVVNVIDFEGVVDDNFRLYYDEQTADTIMPATGAESGKVTVGCPEAGLTNAQAYVAYDQDGSAKVGGDLSDPTGCAIGGAIAPAGATARAGVVGLLDETV